MTAGGDDGLAELVGEHSSQLAKNFFLATFRGPERPRPASQSANQPASHFECFFGDSCLPKAVCPRSRPRSRAGILYRLPRWTPFVGEREKVRKSHGHGNNCKEWRVRSKLPRLSAKSYANIMFAFSTFIFNLPHFTFCFLPLRRCS